MKKILAVILFFFSLSLSAQTMREAFVTMPDSVLSLLTQTNRLDLVDFLEAKMRAKVTNVFDGQTTLDSLTNDYLFMHTTSTGMVEMKLLPINDSTNVICMVHTVCAEACDSKVHFFTPDWHELATSDFLQLPVPDNFFLTVDSSLVDSLNYYRRMADMTLMRASLSSQHHDLSFMLTTYDYLGSQTAEKTAPFLRQSLVYRWENGKYLPAF